MTGYKWENDLEMFALRVGVSNGNFELVKDVGEKYLSVISMYVGKHIFFTRYYSTSKTQHARAHVLRKSLYFWWQRSLSE